MMANEVRQKIISLIKAVKYFAVVMDWISRAAYDSHTHGKHGRKP